MSSKNAVLRLYRTFMRFGDQQLTKKGRVLEVREELNNKEWGFSQHCATGQEHRVDVFKKLLPLDTVPDDPRFDGQSLRAFIRELFKQHKDADRLDAARHLDLGFKGLRVLLEQNYLDHCSASCTTQGVHIEATSRFNGKAEGFDASEQYIFTYRVRITNTREEPVQMLGREWIFQDAHGKVVHQIPLDPANAIVGVQPKIPPGACWEYYSGCPLPTSTGTARGKLVGLILGPAPEGQAMGWLAPTIPTFSLLTHERVRQLPNA